MVQLLMDTDLVSFHVISLTKGQGRMPLMMTILCARLNGRWLWGSIIVAENSERKLHYTIIDGIAVVVLIDSG